MNGDCVVEPRASVKWRYTPGQSLTLAYGLHSRLEPLHFYFAKQQLPTGVAEPNRNLKITKAHHLVMAYELSTGENSRLRIEPFCQLLYDVPVIPRSSFSMINLEMDWFFNDSLINTGKGSTLGLDITMERFLHRGYYYLVTGSFFNARYTADDQVRRNTRFNKKYVINFLFGKEWTLGSNRNDILSVNWKFSLLGGNRLTPVDSEASEAEKEVIYDEARAFSEREPAIYYLDFAISWQKSKPNYSGTLSFQFVNLLFQEEFYGHHYNYRTNQVDTLKGLVVIPNISYRIDF
jgi:hypothetical protein